MNKKQLFLCSECGFLIQEDSFNIIHKTILCNCGNKISMKDSYPNLQAADLIFSSEILYDNCMANDNSNKKMFIKYLSKSKVQFKEDVIDTIINLYENSKSKFSDNNRDDFLNIFDHFDIVLSNKGFSDIEIDAISSSLPVAMKNKMRKPFIVICAASIEMLFNDFFNDLIVKTFPEEGAKIIKKQYSKENVNKCIILANAFLDNKFSEDANNISNGFIDNWKNLREIRNKIVHNNNVYITNNMIEQNFKLLQESIEVFSNLKSKLLLNN